MSSAPWAEQWRALLPGDSERAARALAQGRAYQRSGRVTDFQVTTGRLSGRVQGRRATPRGVEVSVAVLDGDAWTTIVGLLAGQLRHSARLLAGLEPVGLAEELQARGVRLLPQPDEITTTCGCGAVQPCPHTAAVWECATERIDEDPFTLLRLRGRGRERLLAELAATRAKDTVGSPTVALDDLGVAGWTTARSPLEELHLPAVDPRDTAGGAIRLLGDPPDWPRGPSADELLGPLVERAARWARAREVEGGP